jgi:hypothetical protein
MTLARVAESGRARPFKPPRPGTRGAYVVRIPLSLSVKVYAEGVSKARKCALANAFAIVEAMTLAHSDCAIVVGSARGAGGAEVTPPQPTHLAILDFTPTPSKEQT